MRLPWLMNLISNLGVRAYYRVSIAGARVPGTGPVLLVANHNNSLVDPAMVVVPADRTVRFRAKAPLFEDKLIGWLVAAVGSVPVYRQQDERFIELLNSVRNGTLTDADLQLLNQRCQPDFVPGADALYVTVWSPRSPSGARTSWCATAWSRPTSGETWPGMR